MTAQTRSSDLDGPLRGGQHLFRLSMGPAGPFPSSRNWQRHLCPVAQSKLRELIGGASLAAISNWADNYKFTSEGKNTDRWHFVNI
ncbi:hypothetical protein FNJ47_45725 [Bradyrhizobium sp. UFLA 03-164]|uniref:Uncharacterized protein n=1 Tax=Bradyrhizobium uaiense TaxID=2594946 RepID=A0A6P1BW67_9BRAD|nr:hypothetical protein [Bradyrhizobium uaiense]